MRFLFAVLIFLSLVGGATVSKPMDCQTGSFFTLRDTVSHAESNKGEFFVVLEVDGRPIKNSLDETRGATCGPGNTLHSRYIQRQLPLRSMELKIIATHLSATPSDENASKAAGTFFKISNVFPFHTEDGRSYVVTGMLQKAKTCVWIADAETRRQASPRVCLSP